MHPAPLLASLTLAAAAGGWWCWQSYLSQVPAAPAAQPSASAVAGTASSLTYTAAETNRNSARALYDRVLRLETENAKLRRDLAAALGADVSATVLPADPAKEFPMPAALADQTPVTSLDQEARIRMAFTALDTRHSELHSEHKDLSQKLEDAIASKMPPPSPGDLAAKLASQRELSFRQIPEFVAAPADDIVRLVTAAGAAGIDAAGGKARAQAWRCMGFVPDPFDFATAAGSIAAQKSGGFYDAEKNQFFYQQEASLGRSDSRDAFAGPLIAALLVQNFPSAARPPVLTENDDIARARAALAAGDANFSRIRFSVSDQLRANFDRGQAPAPPPPTPNAPYFLTDVWKWTESQGDLFVQALFAKGGLKAVNAAYARPPQSSAEILHPEELYLAEPPFQPVAVALGDPSVNGRTPLDVNTAGELGTYYMIRAWADVDYATTASEGWAGDRYAVWTGLPEHGDQLLWRSVWRTGKDAREFFDALRRLAMQRHKIPHQAEYDAQPGQFRVDDPHRIIRLRLDEAAKTVTLLDATEPDFARALEQRM